MKKNSLPKRTRTKTILSLLLCTVVFLAGCTSTLPPTAVNAAEPTPILQEVISYLEELSAVERFSGVALVGQQNGQIIYEGAFGYANRAFDAKNNLDTRFNLASITKLFTAVSILQLAEEGLLSVDDTMLDLLPDYPNPEIASQITVRQLLTMTAGLPEYIGMEFMMANPRMLQSLSSYLPFFAQNPLLFEPGTQARYSDTAYIVLGLIIESVTGLRFNEYFEQYIFAPLGMDDTGFFTAIPYPCCRWIKPSRLPAL